MSGLCNSIFEKLWLWLFFVMPGYSLFLSHSHYLALTLFLVDFAVLLKETHACLHQFNNSGYNLIAISFVWEKSLTLYNSYRYKFMFIIVILTWFSAFFQHFTMIYYFSILFALICFSVFDCLWSTSRLFDKIGVLTITIIIIIIIITVNPININIITVNILWTYLLFS